MSRSYLGLVHATEWNNNTLCKKCWKEHQRDIVGVNHPAELGEI